MFSYQVHCPSGSPGVQSAGCHSQGQWGICSIPGRASGEASKSHPLSKEQNWNPIPSFLAFCLLTGRKKKKQNKTLGDFHEAVEEPGFLLRAKAAWLKSIWKNKKKRGGTSPEMTMMGLLRMLLRTNMWISSRELY